MLLFPTIAVVAWLPEFFDHGSEQPVELRAAHR
jgi:hypothetical protein